MSWISVKDRLPGELENVLIWCKGSPVTFGFLVYNKEGCPFLWQFNNWEGNDCFWRFDQVTHWMPLPTPPAYFMEEE